MERDPKHFRNHPRPKGESYPVTNNPPPAPPRAACNRASHPYCCEGTMTPAPAIDVDEGTAMMMRAIGWVEKRNGELWLSDEGEKALTAYCENVLSNHHIGQMFT